MILVNRTTENGLDGNALFSNLLPTFPDGHDGNDGDVEGHSFPPLPSTSPTPFSDHKKMEKKTGRGSVCNKNFILRKTFHFQINGSQSTCIIFQFKRLQHTNPIISYIN